MAINGLPMVYRGSSSMYAACVCMYADTLCTLLLRRTAQEDAAEFRRMLQDDGCCQDVARSIADSNSAEDKKGMREDVCHPISIDAHSRFTLLDKNRTLDCISNKQRRKLLKLRGSRHLT